MCRARVGAPQGQAFVGSISMQAEPVWAGLLDTVKVTTKGQ